MYVTMISEKRGHELERQQEEVCGRTWREGREGENGIVTL